MWCYYNIVIVMQHPSPSCSLIKKFWNYSPNILFQASHMTSSLPLWKGCFNYSLVELLLVLLGRILFLVDQCWGRQLFLSNITEDNNPSSRSIHQPTLSSFPLVKDQTFLGRNWSFVLQWTRTASTITIHLKTLNHID